MARRHAFVLVFVTALVSMASCPDAQADDGAPRKGPPPEGVVLTVLGGATVVVGLGVLVRGALQNASFAPSGTGCDELHGAAERSRCETAAEARAARDNQAQDRTLRAGAIVSSVGALVLAFGVMVLASADTAATKPASTSGLRLRILPTIPLARSAETARVGAFELPLVGGTF